MPILHGAEARAWLLANSKYFLSSELDCPCCHKLIIDTALAERLNTLREMLDKPLSVSSCYRCPAHNSEVGGVSGSYHIQGKAADIRTADKAFQNALVTAAKTLFKGVIVYSSWVHVDVREKSYFGKGGK